MFTDSNDKEIRSKDLLQDNITTDLYQVVAVSNDEAWIRRDGSQATPHPIYSGEHFSVVEENRNA